MTEKTNEFLLFVRLSQSKFRSSFQLKEKDFLYIKEKGLTTIERHAHEFIQKRLVPNSIPNDGKQTPMNGHPVFIAQHATATCCRNCLYKWHKIPKGVELTSSQQSYIVKIIMSWITIQYTNWNSMASKEKNKT